MLICNHPLETDWPTGAGSQVYINGVLVVWGQPWVRLPDGRAISIKWPT